MSQNENTETTDLKNQLTTLNERILQAEEAGLKDDLALHLHEDFTIVRASGKKENRQAFLDALPEFAGDRRPAALEAVGVPADQVKDFDKDRPADSRTPDKLQVAQASAPIPSEMLRRLSAAAATPVQEGAVKTPIATPIAAATPMAGAPRIIMSRMAVATSS